MKMNAYTPVLLVLGGLWLAGPAVAQTGSSENPPSGVREAALKPGTVLDQTTASLAADYLPPEILAHYQRGEYRSGIVEWRPGEGTLGRAFAEQTKRNAETLTVNEVGTIIEKATGKQPRYVYGTPFPNLDPSDPQAGVKAVWNYFYSTNWWNGNSRTIARVLWLNKTGLDREMGQDVNYKYYDGMPPEYRPDENPHNLLAQFISKTIRPTDLYGTVSLSWRYRDPDQRDLVWAYVPALRRVRAVSPANRSDGFLGSDMSQDDGQFFDGKPEDFVWTLVGERDILRFVDPYRLRGTAESIKLPDGSWRGISKPVPHYGFEAPGWTGVAWAPVEQELALRKAWVVEGVPRDRYYLYGKLQLLIDQDTWQGTFNRKFSWQGELLMTLQLQGGPASSPDGVHYFIAGPGGGLTFQLAENVKLNRATAIMITNDRNDRLVPLEASLFDHQTLHHLGK